jgi:hypothetical protein
VASSTGGTTSTRHGRTTGRSKRAEIIAWAINDKPAALVRIDHVTCGELHDGYAVLTGLEPLHGLTSVCAGVPPVTRS